MFSQTGRLSNSAPFWNSMPMRARVASCSRAASARMSVPSISMLPASGSIRPRMHFSSTDLPEPEPPITTIEVLGHDVEVDAVQHELLAEALAEVAEADLRDRSYWGLAHRAKNISVST